MRFVDAFTHRPAARALWLALVLALVVVISASCGIGRLSFGDRSEVASPDRAREEVAGDREEGRTPSVAASLGGYDPDVVAVLFADDRIDRLQAIERLCRRQVPLRVDDPSDEALAAASAWAGELVAPKDERSRLRTRIDDLVGLEDVHHAPGFELVVSAGGGLLIFTREGELVARVGEGEPVEGVAFHDVDEDGQAEIFLKRDSGANSGNRYTEIEGYKELSGSLARVLERRLYETAFRFVHAGLGARLALVRVEGRPLLVVDPEGRPEYLRWSDETRSFVSEADGPI